MNNSVALNIFTISYNHHLYPVQNIFITPPKPIIIKKSLPIPRTPILWKPQICILSLWIYPFWIFHINGVVEHVTFCDQLLSLSLFLKLTHFVAYMHAPLLSVAEYCSICTKYVLLPPCHWGSPQVLGAFQIILIILDHITCFVPWMQWEQVTAPMNRTTMSHLEALPWLFSLIQGFCRDGRGRCFRMGSWMQAAWAGQRVLEASSGRY